MKYFYSVVEEEPSSLEDGDYVIKPLDFMEEIKTCSRYKPAAGIMAPNYLRTIAVEVGNKYDKLFNPYRDICPSDYSGIKFSSDKDVSNIVRAMFDATYRKIYKAYLCSKIISRPYDCKRVILVGKDAELSPTIVDMGFEKYDTPTQPASYPTLNTNDNMDLEFLANNEPIKTKKYTKKNK